MDPDKLLKFFSKIFSRYFYFAAATLKHPGSTFAPVQQDGTGGELLTGNGKVVPRISPQLIGFVVISIVLGMLINALLPGRLEPPELFTGVALSIVSWIAYTSLIHLFCKIMRGKGQYLETVAAGLYLFGVLYVLTSFFAVFFSALILGKVIALNPRIIQVLFGLDTVIPIGPITYYYSIFAVMLTVYLPLALKRVHGFGWFRAVCVALPSVALLIYSGASIYIVTGHLGATIFIQ